MDAIVYVVRQGVTWRALPADLAQWNTAFWYFQAWQKDGIWGYVEDAIRCAEGRPSETPSAGVVNATYLPTQGERILNS